MRKEYIKMSERERMYQLLDTLPDTKISYIIGYIQGLTTDANDAPNTETVEAIKELESGCGNTFEGSTSDFMKMMLGDE